MSNELSTTNNTDFVLYTDLNGNVSINVVLKNETIWLTQKNMAELFGVQKAAISKHLSNIFEQGELSENAVVSILETTASDGKNYKISHYNLDAVISVGYRINSAKATQFRIWATQILKEFIIKGFVLDDERLKNGKKFDKDYFRELLERVRSIRASERRIYQQITDIFAECSIDYNPGSEITHKFYAHVQDKFHFAIAGKTAAEIIYNSADAKKPYMGLNTFKNAPKGRVLKSDVTIAKNYLTEEQIKKLERTITAFFDYIENIIENRNTFTMQAFSESVNRFLDFNEYRILENFGSIKKEKAELKAHAEYTMFNRKQKIESDFDRNIRALEEIMEVKL